ncbi:small s protein [Cercophora scortea]|uniref:Small s protein n=1 Tax=Cercophora scortea TaxID=314031 RepID=A0AAE0I259_9PEZI|nr:small s protein [Cercophora scortea]
MAESFALAANVIGVIGFMLQLGCEASGAIQSGSSISTADCAREAASLRAHCERVKRLDNIEAEMEETKRIKTIAAEVEVLAEEITKRLDNCKAPTGQKEFKHFRDVIVVVWRGMRMDPDAQMRRLAALRNEIQSELLVSLTKKLDWVDIQSTKSFQKLDDGFKALIGDMMKVAEHSEHSAQERHAQIMAQFQKLDPAIVGPAVGDDQGTIKQKMIEDLKQRLWFSSISHRHHAIRVAHKKTFEWIFTGQKRKPSGNGLYWVSGRAGTGKSSLMRFLEDDSRTRPLFQKWAKERPLVLATFYFWNSEAAGDSKLKSLSGLYRGILYSLIHQNSEFAELLFPDHLIAGRKWEANFPTLLDMAHAFETLVNADELPAAVGLIIDGLDEFDATTSEQMRMAEMLCQAAGSPSLKIVVSSRPENAFETTFVNSTKLRLHELTQADQRIYVCDKLHAIPRLKKIATDQEQQFLFDLVVERSEGIFPRVHLAVETLIQEIDVSMSVLKLQELINDIPSGRKELAQVFDHMLRNRIPVERRRLGHRLIQTLRYAYRLRDRVVERIMVPQASLGEVTSSLLSFFFNDDVSSAIQMPVKPLLKTEAASRIESSGNLIRRYCGGLLEARPLDLEATVDNPELHFLHKDVMIFLNQPKTQQFLQRSLEPIKTNLYSNVLNQEANWRDAPFTFRTLKHSGREVDQSDALFTTSKRSNLYLYVDYAMIVARDAEKDDPRTVEMLLDEIDRMLCQHFLDHKSGVATWRSRAGYADGARRRPRHVQDAGTRQPPDFLSLAIQHGLFRYVESKLRSRKAGKAKLATTSGPSLLNSACWFRLNQVQLRGSIRPETVKLLLDHGADPNEIFQGRTCWENTLHAISRIKRKQLEPHEFKALAEVLRLLLNAGADPHATYIDNEDLGIRHTAEQQIGITFIHRIAGMHRPFSTLLQVAVI